MSWVTVALTCTVPWHIGIAKHNTHAKNIHHVENQRRSRSRYLWWENKRKTRSISIYIKSRKHHISTYTSCIRVCGTYFLSLLNDKKYFTTSSCFASLCLSRVGGGPTSRHEVSTTHTYDVYLAVFSVRYGVVVCNTGRNVVIQRGIYLYIYRAWHCVYSKSKSVNDEKKACV